MGKENYIFFNGSRIKNIAGETFGYLVPQKVVGIKNRYAVWECKCCKCGGIRQVSAKLLKDGVVTTCSNCVKEKRKSVIQKIQMDKNPLSTKDLTGQKFGFWTVLKKGKYKNGTQMWICKCKCGTTEEVSVYNLVYGTSTSCGCSTSYNLIGKKIGLLQVVGITRKKDGIACKCKCKCDCGNEIIVSASALQWKRSCGCMKQVEKEEHTILTWAMQGGQKLRSNNTSGVRGVNRANGKWGARITFKGKSYWLGTFNLFENAVEARKEAENRLYTDFLMWYNEKYSKRKRLE